MKNVLVFTSILLASSASFAQSNAGASKLYGEIGYHNVELELEGDDFSTDNGAVSALIGYKFHPNLSAELFVATGAGDGSDMFLGNRVKTEIKNSYGVFLRPSTMLGDKLELFGRLGYLESKLRVSGGGVSLTEKDGSFAYGLGANYYFSNKLYGQLSYTSFYDKDDGEIKGAGVSLGYRF